MNLNHSMRIGALLAGLVLTVGCGASSGGSNGGGGDPTASGLHVTVVLPAAYRNGGPTGFATAVSGIEVYATLDGVQVTPDEVQWSIKDFWGLDAPGAVTLTSATGATTGFDVPALETLRVSANEWLKGVYAGEGADEFRDYVQAPPREQLLSFGPQQIQAMSFQVVATVRKGSETASGSALVSPATVSSGQNTLPLGMMVVGNAVSDTGNAWVLQYMPTEASATATFGSLPAGVTLHGEDTKNPWVVPTVAGFYQLQNNANPPIVFRVSTYHGTGRADTDKGADGVACADCHTGQYALTDKFTEWAGSAHGHSGDTDPAVSLFQYGLDGHLGPAYKESCISCHVVGYSKVPTADNAGFDDVAANWEFPVPGAGAFDALPAALKHRGAVQCESCHGPLEPTDHSMVGPFPHGPSAILPVASMSASICMSCHDGIGDGSQGPQWSTSPHSDTAFAMSEQPANASCARCHNAEGFMQYLPLQQAGGTGWGNLPASALTSLSAATVHSQTCQTCHDPHTTELRIDGDTKQTAGMFTITNAGAGAICIVCHNSRGGAIKQGTYAITSLSRLGPHNACQGDMFAGRNAFFVSDLTASDGPTVLPHLAPHAATSDSCAGCHVKWVPEDIAAQYRATKANHTFKSSVAICGDCHTAGLGEGIQSSITTKATALQNRVTAILSEKLLRTAGFDTAAGARTDPATGAAIADPTSRTVLPAAVQSIAADPMNGAVIVTLVAGGSFEVTLDNIKAVGTTTNLIDVTNATSQTFAKAYFNLLFVDKDASKGLHNPAFTGLVLDNSTAQLVGLTLP